MFPLEEEKACNFSASLARSWYCFKENSTSICPEHPFSSHMTVQNKLATLGSMLQGHLGQGFVKNFDKDVSYCEKPGSINFDYATDLKMEIDKGFGFWFHGRWISANWVEKSAVQKPFNSYHENPGSNRLMMLQVENLRKDILRKVEGRIFVTISASITRQIIDFVSKNYSEKPGVNCKTVDYTFWNQTFHEECRPDLYWKKDPGHLRPRFTQCVNTVEVS